MVRIVDDILTPADKIVMKFEGRNPFAATTVIPSMLRYTLKVTGKDILETDVRWDNLGGDRKEFYGRWLGKRTEDAWTKTFVRVVIQGEQNSSDKMGRCKIELKGTVITNYDYNNFIQRALWWIFNYTFYYKQRRLYLEEAKDYIFQMKDQLQRLLGILPPEETLTEKEQHAA